MGPNSINTFRGGAATGGASASASVSTSGAASGAAAADGAAQVAGSQASVGAQGTQGSADAGKLQIKYGDALKAGRLQGGLQARDAAYAKAVLYIQGINPDIAMMSARP